jgi:hypothetical protein
MEEHGRELNGTWIDEIMKERRWPQDARDGVFDEAVSLDIETKGIQKVRKAQYYRPAEIHNKEQNVMVTKNLIDKNRFYIGSNGVLANNWGHETLEDAIEDAKQRLASSGNKGATMFIVQIIRVVKPEQPKFNVEEV